MSDVFSTEWSHSGVLVRLYAVVCETAAEPPCVVRFLADYPRVTAAHKAAVLLFDQFYHWRFGEGRPCAWYFEQFPECRREQACGLELAIEEFGYRRDRGETLSVDEYAAGFPEWAEPIRHELSLRTEQDRFATTAGVLRQVYHGGGLTTTRFRAAVGDNTTLRPEFAEPTESPVDLTAFPEPTSLASLRPDVLRLIECEMHEAAFQPGQHLMREGEPGDSLMVLMEGQVEIRTGSAGGKTKVIARLDGPQIFGEMALLASEPRKADVVARTPVRTMVLPAASFHALAAQHPSISLLLTAVIAQRLGQSKGADVLWGRTLGEHYRVTGRLGRGGMAVVYDARDERDGRRVALKMMSHRLVYDPAAREQFRQEADIIEAFDHPHISRMLGRFQEFHTYFTVVEFCDGCSLFDVLARNGALDEQTTRRVLGQVASALAYAHDRHVVHRDVKPGNVMLCCDGKAQLLDFGLAKSVADTHPTLVEAVVGTPRYMAPEQILGNDIGPPADCFSLGLLAWEMLTGEPLLPQTDWIGLLRHHANWDLSRLDEQRRRVDPTTYEFLRHALHPEPDQRHVDLKEIAGWAAPVDLSGLQGFA